MTNEDVIKCEDITSMPRDMVSFVMDNYRNLKDDWETIKGLRGVKWEVACMKDNDWKYGRFIICRDRMLMRDKTDYEFYHPGRVNQY